MDVGTVPAEEALQEMGEDEGEVSHTLHTYHTCSPHPEDTQRLTLGTGFHTTHMT